MNNKRILVTNQGITENYGDVAINDTIVSYFKDKDFEVEFFPFYSEELVLGKRYKRIPKVIIKSIYHIPSLLDFLVKNAIKRNLKKINYDAIIIGGGELLCGHREFNSSLYTWTKIAKKYNIPVYLVGVSGDGELPKSLLERNRESLNRCSWIYVRDGYTKKICNEIYKVECECGPDVVFGYNQICNKNLTKNEIKNGLICVPINFSYAIKHNMGLESIEEYYMYLLNLIKKNVKEKEKIIITSSVYDDNDFNKKFSIFVKNELKEHEVFFEEYTNIDEYIKLLEKSRIVISARMHALILALINNCEIVAIPFKKKLEVFSKEYSSKTDILNKEQLVIEKFEKLHNIIL